MEFDNNFCAIVTQRGAGIHAFELLVNRFSGAVYPEPGPNMMWNTKYGMMDFERDGQPAGMLSVNGFSGAVWYHSWHGAFIAERDVN